VHVYNQYLQKSARSLYYYRCVGGAWEALLFMISHLSHWFVAALAQ